jgi:hypothetical protein
VYSIKEWACFCKHTQRIVEALNPAAASKLYIGLHLH